MQAHSTYPPAVLAQRAERQEQAGEIAQEIDQQYDDHDAVVTVSGLAADVTSSMFHLLLDVLGITEAQLQLERFNLRLSVIACIPI